ncbi:MAG: NADH-quinone oxidoreductase subunit L [Actinomycetia bacterium]|nr:NADH-quinone oxidoreductase subunit L [Actinomycetes bacterium]
MTAALLMVLVPAVAALLGLLLGGMSRPLAAAIAVGGTASALGVALYLALLEPWAEPLIGTGFGEGTLPLGATVVDGLASTVALMVCFVSLLVQIYSIGYMREEPRYSSYAAFISLFTAAMLAVVVAGDLLLLVIGWEVMGLCSYLLIGQRWEQEEARRAAVKAFLVTKIGDIGFIIGIVVLIGATATTLLPDAVRAAADDPTVATVASGLILLGVLGKSAQFPLHAWLPDAMAGPSPVSALIHAATMVAAGVYVVARLYPMYLAAPAILTAMAVIACVTMLGAAVIAVVQDDLKRVLAWSTVSQLAYMVAALALGARDAAIFHMLSHAFSKALLFLAAGAVIHAVGSGALRELGGLRRSMPVTFITMTIGLLALVGVFPLAGFFSKESVLVAAEHAAHGDAEVASWVGWTVLVVSILTIAVTAAYAQRLWLLTWSGPRRDSSSGVREVPAVMFVPLVVLVVPAVVFGFSALERAWLPTWIQATVTEPLGTAEALRPEVATVVLSVVAVIVGAGAALVFRHRETFARGRAGSFVAAGFGFDAVYQGLVVRPFLVVVGWVTAFDRSAIQRSVSGVGVGTLRAGSLLQRPYRGDVQRYVSSAVTAVVVAIVVMLVAIAT